MKSPTETDSKMLVTSPKMGSKFHNSKTQLRASAPNALDVCEQPLLSERKAKALSKSIDKEISNEKAIMKNAASHTIKLLLLGSGDAGLSY